MKLYCELCKKVQPVRIDNCRDAKTNEPYQDIVCAECDLVIASGTDIAQPEQRGHCTCGDPEALGVVHFRTRPCFHYTEPLAQPEQEPVAIVNEGMGGIEWLDKPLPDDIPLYTAPPKREWVGLTDEQFLEACQLIERGNYLVALRQVQAKLKEKNGA